MSGLRRGDGEEKYKKGGDKPWNIKIK